MAFTGILIILVMASTWYLLISLEIFPLLAGGIDA